MRDEHSVTGRACCPRCCLLCLLPLCGQREWRPKSATYAKGSSWRTARTGSQDAGRKLLLFRARPWPLPTQPRYAQAAYLPRATTPMQARGVLPGPPRPASTTRPCPGPQWTTPGDLPCSAKSLNLLLPNSRENKHSLQRLRGFRHQHEIESLSGGGRGRGVQGRCARVHSHTRTSP